MRRVIPAAVVILGASFLPGCRGATPPSPTPSASYFEFQGSNTVDTFVIELTDAAQIQHARDLLRGVTTSRAHVMGLIIKERRAYNAAWSYHLDPATIEFFDLATEVCDADMRYVEEHLVDVGGALLPGNRWCPWMSHLTVERAP